MKNKAIKILLLATVISLLLCVSIISLGNESIAYADGGITINSNDTFNIETYISEAKTARNEHMYNGQMLSAGNSFRNGCVFTTSGGNLNANVSADDNIVNLVPKQYFTTNCEVLNTEGAYGYFIKTEVKTNYNDSTVIIFKIDKTLVDYEVTMTITTVFSADYYCLTANEATLNVYNMNDGANVTGSSISASKTSSTALVFPAMSAKCGSSNIAEYLCFAPSKRYELKDISFATRIYNADSLNQSNTGYNVDNDYL